MTRLRFFAWLIHALSAIYLFEITYIPTARGVVASMANAKLALTSNQRKFRISRQVFGGEDVRDRNRFKYCSAGGDVGKRVDIWIDRVLMYLSRPVKKSLEMYSTINRLIIDAY